MKGIRSSKKIYSSKTTIIKLNPTLSSLQKRLKTIKIEKSANPLKIIITTTIAHNVFSHNNPNNINYIKKSLPSLYINRIIQALNSIIRYMFNITSKATKVIS